VNLITMSAQQIQTLDLPGPSAVLRMADTPEQLVPIKDMANVAAQLDLVFADTVANYGTVRSPSIDDAGRIVDFALDATAPHFVAQCQVGVGRCQAVIAALLRIRGLDPAPVTGRGTYNRLLYRLMLEAAGLPPDPEPLVSIAVRVKYPADRLHLFLLSMQRQRHNNWQVVAVTDGPNQDARRLIWELDDYRVRLIETPEARGCWGHPYRQLALDACQGDYLGLSNDDNYYCPGYLEQMLFALQSQTADLAVCQVLHSYAAWSVSAGIDLGCWIARRELVRKVPWPGEHFTADTSYIEALIATAGKVVAVPRPLFVHN